MKSLIILLIACMTCPLMVYANETYVASSDLNVRSGAGKNYPVAFLLKKGDNVELLSENGEWFEIKYSDKIGFAHSKFLRRLPVTENRSSEFYESYNLKIDILVLLIVGFVWIFPLLIIMSSSKTTSGEKMAWLLAVVFISWLAWIFYALLAPLKQRQED